MYPFSLLLATGFLPTGRSRTTDCKKVALSVLADSDESDGCLKTDLPKCRESTNISVTVGRLFASFF